MAKVTAEQLLKPSGDIDAALLFPDDGLQIVYDQLNGWIAKGYALAIEASLTDATEDLQNRAVENYVYYKVYNDVHTRMAASPIRTDVAGEAGQSFDMAQIREFRNLAESYLDAFNTLLLTAQNSTAVEPARSRSLVNAYRW